MKIPTARHAPRRGSLPTSSVTPEVILLPVKPWFVLLTVFLAFALNLAPLEGVARFARPDFLALVILFWSLHEPRLLGVGVAWLLGLLADVADAALFGQHALAYAVLAYAAGQLRRRVLRFTLWQQSLHVAVLLALCLLLTWAIRRVGGAAGVDAGYFVAALTGALLWPPLVLLLQWPQRPTPSPSEL